MIITNLTPIFFTHKKPSAKNRGFASKSHSGEKLSDKNFDKMLKKAAKRSKNIPIQDLDKDLFFIRMAEYKKDERWAQRSNRLACKTADLINANCSFDEISEYISENLRRINNNDSFCVKKKDYITSFGICDRPTWRGGEYYKIYKKICDEFEPKDVFDKYRPKGHEKNTNVCQIEFKDTLFPIPGISIVYGCNFAQGHSNLDIVEKVYKNFKKIKSPTKGQINFTTAKIQWLIAQECPFARGNDSFANVLTRAIYISQGYKVSPVKSGKSLDFEAFYRDLDDYIKVYPKLFEIEPYKICRS